MTTPPVRRPKYAQQYAARERLKSVEAQDHIVRGRIFAQGIGQFLTELSFPVTFYEKPILFTGAVELEGETALFEHIPSAQISVVGWKTSFPGYYTGVHVSVLVTGRTDQTAWIPYKVEGKALTSLNVGTPDA